MSHSRRLIQTQCGSVSFRKRHVKLRRPASRRSSLLNKMVSSSFDSRMNTTPPSCDGSERWRSA
eukprot:scaffold105891_cov37-Tisochrysis_lutea.AAC.4